MPLWKVQIKYYLGGGTLLPNYKGCCTSRNYRENYQIVIIRVMTLCVKWFIMFYISAGLPFGMIQNKINYYIGLGSLQSYKLDKTHIQS